MNARRKKARKSLEIEDQKEQQVVTFMLYPRIPAWIPENTWKYLHESDLFDGLMEVSLIV